MARKKIKQNVCANCKYAFREHENYCPNCGQENHFPNQPIKHYITELLETILHIDSKFFHTVISLLRYPGKVTKEYNENIRAQYMPPIRLYVFISFVFFVLYQIEGVKSDTSAINIDPQTETIPFDSSFSKDISSDSTLMKNDSNEISVGHINIKISKNELNYYKQLKEDQIDSLILANGFTPGYWNRKFYKQIIKSMQGDRQDFQNLSDKIVKYTSIAMFFLMPLFGFIIYLLYWRMKRNYYESLIFSIHFHIAAFIILSLHLILQLVFPIPLLVSALIILGLFTYITISLKVIYGQSWMKTLIKSFLAGFLYAINLLITLAIVSVLGWWAS